MTIEAGNVGLCEICQKNVGDHYHEGQWVCVHCSPFDKTYDHFGLQYFGWNKDGINRGGSY